MVALRGGGYPSKGRRSSPPHWKVKKIFHMGGSRFSPYGTFFLYMHGDLFSSCVFFHIEAFFYMRGPFSPYEGPFWP